MPIINHYKHDGAELRFRPPQIMDSWAPPAYKNNILDIRGKEVNTSAREFLEHYENPWDKEIASGRVHNRLVDSFAGRVAIRTFSRGVIGAGFMATTGVLTNGYHPGVAYEELGAIQKGFRKMENGLDAVFEPIARVFTKEANPKFCNSINFNPVQVEEAIARHGKGLATTVDSITGRTIGQDMFDLSFSYAMGSVGDAWGRRLAALADPNVKTGWQDEDGHLDLGKMAKSTVRAAVKILAYNQAEDWAASIPYVWQVRAHRKWLTEMYPGAEHLLDQRLGGAAHRIEVIPPTQEGDLAKVKVTGDYSHVYWQDTAPRFGMYNMYTLVFRDLFNHAGYKMQEWRDHGAALDFSFVQHPIQNSLGLAQDTVEYLGKSTIKAGANMFAAAGIFPLLRSPVAKFRTIFFSPEHGLVTNRPAEQPHIDPLTGKELFHPDMALKSEHAGANAPYQHSSMQKSLGGAPEGLRYFAGNVELDPSFFKEFDSYAPENNTQRISRKMYGVGNLAEGIASSLYKPVHAALSSQVGGKVLNWLNPAYEANQFRSRLFAHSYTNAAVSYIPYMVTKYEAANQYDTPEMDAASYQLIDGIIKGDGHAFKNGLRDIKNVLTLQPVSDETIEISHQPRGLLNSQREANDAAEKSAGRIRETFADKYHSRNAQEKRAAQCQMQQMQQASHDSDTRMASENVPDSLLPSAQVVQASNLGRVHHLSRQFPANDGWVANHNRPHQPAGSYMDAHLAQTQQGDAQWRGV